MSKQEAPTIRVGIGGWTYGPWRGTFYPDGLTQKRELEYASRKVTSIEINGTFYGSQKPASFIKWHDETPENFVFSLKGPRFTTNRRVLAEAGESIDRFFSSGVLLLKNKLGPINWQFAQTKKFDAEDFEAFLKLLPQSIDGRSIRHAVEVRHESFQTSAFVELARKYSTAIVLAGDSAFPIIAAFTAPFVYIRIMGTVDTEPKGYGQADIEMWVKRAKQLSAGKMAEDMGGSDDNPPAGPREIFLYVISGFKTSNPAAAMAIIENINKK